ncbi:MAG: carbamoyltransferase HypF [Desulfobacterales bacterium]|jgi:hydrogenase maturation protein HypF|nr:carbamoyltransferase HypF [Desulfobacterales bacterium]MCU0602882.1 carbamoyltransferase HypF [Desulfobacterales bacterium]
MEHHHEARRLQVNGIVQGVGFRPFVYQLALRLGLKGEVANTSSGVSIHIEGPADRLRAFEADLAGKAPPLAHIVEVISRPEIIKSFSDFRITASRGGAAMATLISPDAAVCADCLREMFDPADRRYRYPFINCTNCGPRYTIIDDIPYDRPKTSMRHFTMCAACQAEYDDPLDRRFHAQPNACPVCGPRVGLWDARRREMGPGDPIAAAAELIRQGQIVAVKGLGGFHLAADALNAAAVARLRQRKLREEKPFAVMSPDLDAIRAYAVVEPDDETLLRSIQRPIVLLRKNETGRLAEEVAPRNPCVGAMLPYTPLHHLLLAHGFAALVMTSGNLSEEPIAIDNDDAFDRLAGIADYFLVHDRDIYLRSDDSVVRRAAGETRFLRRSRGYVPVPVFLKHALPPILACGAELKSTVCITKGDQAFISQHIGDLENLSTYEFFQKTVGHLQRILGVRPEVIACDLHPDYLSTRWADEQEAIPKIRVQHHHAHIVSGMAEHRLEGAVIGVACDGTGYGPDGTVWGGEVLVADAEGFERAAHLACVPMPGSAAAIKEPWRMAVSYLNDAFGADLWGLDLLVLRAAGPDKVRLMLEMAAKRLNSPLTSSLGRLFDGVAAIAGLRSRVTYEGQAAMELEMAAAEETESVYDYAWEEGAPCRILPAPIIRGVAADVGKGLGVPAISAKFHNTLVRMFSDLCESIRRQCGLGRVVLSGGVFQNARLLTGLIPALAARGFEVYSHRQVPANDGGIALGQALIAAESIAHKA